MKTIIDLQSKTNPNVKIRITVVDGRYSQIDKLAGTQFPFKVGQTFNRGLEAWCEVHRYLFNGVDTAKQNRKIFGICTKDVPRGDMLRLIYPNKFR